MQLPAGWVRRFGFRWLLLVMAGQSMASVLRFVPGIGGWMVSLLFKGWMGLVPWVGREVLRLPEAVAFRPSGSGDTLFMWVQTWCLLALTFFGALIWSWFDRARRSDLVVHAIVRMLVRYALGSAMIFYGLSKVLHLQMPTPGVDRLIQPYGESSPMGLVWTFMGLSPAYSFFAGACELIGGLLLLFRRTTLLGALMVVGVMANVVLINLCFDVPVKLYSTQLLVAAVFLTGPDWPRLRGVLFTDQAVAPKVAAMIPGRAWSRRTRSVLAGVNLVVVGWVVYSMGWSQWQRATAQANMAPGKTRGLEGLYEVRGFVQDGAEQALVVTEGGLWRYVSFSAHESMRVRRMDGSRRSYRLVVDPGKAGAFGIRTSSNPGIMSPLL